MWLLRTDRAELRYFPSPEAVPGGYAILSHAWGDHEQTFQETQVLRRRCKWTRNTPRDLASEKVRECCKLAERHGYRWLWDDTCCIDKTSSTELSEAINSMFVWYSSAEMCFAYLADVESDCDLHAQGSAFRTARWHSRGWTLQELIAPLFIIFVARDWKTIGTKQELAPLLEEITGVPQQVLTREAHFSIVSVAERMSWASGRSTTRVEDKAYCLMGLFNVNMPTLYGEGRQAYYRLQQEIMKQSFDTSLFAWGGLADSENTKPVELPEIYEAFDRAMYPGFFLLAPSPKCFRKREGMSVRYTPSVAEPLQPYLERQWKANADGSKLQDSDQKWSGPFGQIKLPSFSVTHYGVKCRFPIIESDGLTIAVLLCETSDEHLGLLLFPSNDPVQDPSRRKYYVGYGFHERRSSNKVWCRIISLGNDFYNLRMPMDGKTVTAEWRDIFVVDTPPPAKKDGAPSLCIPLHSIKPAPPFRLPHWLIGRLMEMGLELRLPSRPVVGKPLPMVAAFWDTIAIEAVVVILGTCVQLPGTPAPWAKAVVCWKDSDNWQEGRDYSHDCREHHIMAWPNWAKDFGDDERTVRLSFSRCKLTPEHTLVVHVELAGATYDAIKKRTNVELPSREALGLRMDAVGPRPLSLLAHHRAPGTPIRPSRPQSVARLGSKL